MTKLGQISTHKVYEDPEIVKNYIKRHALNPEMSEYIVKFSKTIPGKRIIDIGCGPGHDSYMFAKLGFDVLGIDYSTAMIKAAEKLEKTEHKPTFQVQDMRDLSHFGDNSFDGAWICSSIFHISKEKVSDFLEELKRVLVPNGRVFISFKEGTENEALVEEEKYGQKIVREFSYWTQDEFAKLVENLGFKVIAVSSQKTGVSHNKPITYIRFELEVIK